MPQLPVGPDEVRDDWRIGVGYDSHAFAPGRPLWLGGLQIDHPLGLAGHSDADVLLHAICDALLGALAMGDIGTHFPDTDPRWQDAASRQFVMHAHGLVRERGWAIANLDCTLILQRPKLQPLNLQLRESLAALLQTDRERISVKGKTPEGLNLEHTAVAHAVVLLRRSSPPAG